LEEKIPGIVVIRNRLYLIRGREDLSAPNT
jgi:hypothetical protein